MTTIKELEGCFLEGILIRPIKDDVIPYHGEFPFERLACDLSRARAYRTTMTAQEAPGKGSPVITALVTVNGNRFVIQLILITNFDVGVNSFHLIDEFVMAFLFHTSAIFL